jgi:hypothetical protein
MDPITDPTEALQAIAEYYAEAIAHHYDNPDEETY